jgi:subtilisin family serine protease
MSSQKSILCLLLASLCLLVLAIGNSLPAHANQNNNKNKFGIGVGIVIKPVQPPKLKKKKAPAPVAKKKVPAKAKVPAAAKKKVVQPDVELARSENAPPVGETRFRKREVLFVVKPGQADTTAQDIALAFNLSRIAETDLLLIERRVHRYAIQDGRSVAIVVTALEGDARIEIAQPNYLYELAQEVAASTPSFAATMIDLSAAHSLANGKGVKVAVVDSRIDVGHPALSGRIGASFVAVDRESAAPDAHGTAMAGAIAASRQVLGVAPAASLLAAEVFSRDELGIMNGNTYNILRGVDWAHGSGAAIQNLSFAGPRDPLLSRLIKAATEKGAIFVAAAGNEGPKSAPLYPAADENVVGTTAIDSKKRVYRKANRGDHILVAAPGVDVIAIAPGGKVALSTGTSIAAAQVSGMLALALEKTPDLGHGELAAKLESASQKLDLPSNVAKFGLLNALRIVDPVGSGQDN